MQNVILTPEVEGSSKVFGVTRLNWVLRYTQDDEKEIPAQGGNDM